MRFRRATMDDALDVLAWRNDPLAVAMSKTPGLIDSQSHLAWFSGAIQDSNRLLLIILEADRKLGLVRFDRAEGGWAVSINIAPDERGRGYGQAALQDAIELFRGEMGPASLFAEIRTGNEQSFEIFRRCGFVPQTELDGWQLLVRRRT